MKLIRIFFAIFVFTIFSNIAHSFNGSGPLKFSKEDFEYFLAYMRGDGSKYGEVGKKKGTPGMFAVNQEGKWSYYMYCPIKYNGNCRFEFGKVIQRCTKQSKQRGYGRCYLFANQRKIVWDGKNIRLPRKYNQTYIESVFKENGWYGSINKQTPKPEKKTSNQTTETKTTSNDTVEQLKKLNDLYKAGILTKSEFTKAKKKILD
mgnify:CR=1 FL=1